jgi:hypothetical protein
MLRKPLILGLVAALFAVAPASAQFTDITDIQVYDAAGGIVSPLAGTTVTVKGVLTMQAGLWNSGTHYIQDATGGIQLFDNGSPGFAIGDEVELTGVVSAFGGEIQLGSPFSWTFVGSPGQPAPLVLTPGQILDFDNDGFQSAGDYELTGTLVATTGIIDAYDGGNPALGSNANFAVIAGGDTLQVFIDRDTGLDAGGLSDGASYQISGIAVPRFTVFQLKPRIQSDLFDLLAPPVIDAISPSPWTPAALQSVTVSATITDNGSVVGASLYYRDSGAGAFTSTPMANVGGDVYEATIPGTAAAGLDYYIEAQDDAAQFSTAPGDAPASWRSLAVGTTSIVDIQSMMNAPSDTSAFIGQLVNVEAVITFAPGEFSGAPSQYMIEEETGGPWSGLFVFEGSGGNVLFRGDKVRISGTIGEFAGSTQILPQSAAAVEIIGFGSALPGFAALNTTDARQEMWENVMVQTLHSTVVDTLFGGTDYFLQTTPADSLLRVDPAPGVGFISTLGEELVVSGLLDSRFGAWELVPRDDLDVFQIATPVEDLPTVKRGARLTEVSPNPFNPRTEVSFSIPREGLADLAIYNVRGERIRTLLRGLTPAGDQSLTWNGQDDGGHVVASGVYFVRLRFETERPTIQKVTLMK